MDKETLIKALGRIEGNPTIVVHSDRIRADFDITGHE